jgi:hypothetical protein
MIGLIYSNSIKKEIFFLFIFIRKTIDMSPSHNDDNSLDDLGSTGSEPTTKAFQFDYNNQQYLYHHHMKPITTDIVDSGGIFKDYHSL